MFKMKKINLLVIICLYVVQIIFSDMYSIKTYATSTVSEQVYEIQHERKILMQAPIESNLIGDVNGDGNRNSIDFAFMRLVLLGLKKDFDISNGTWAADTDGNNIFNSIDFAYMRMYLLGLIKVFPAEKTTVTPTVIVTPTLEPTHIPTLTPIPTPTSTMMPTPTNTKYIEKPSVPQNFLYTTKTESSVTLSWDKSIDDRVIGYNVYLDNTYFVTTESNVFTVKGLEANTLYGFSIMAKDASGNLSDPTEYIVVTTMDVIISYDFVKITGGANHTIALKKDGTVCSWGENYAGQLGDNSGSNSSVPVKVNNLSDIKEISAG